MKNIFLLGFYVLIISISIFAQSESCSIVTTDKNKITKVENFNADCKKDASCNIVTYEGTISGLSYEFDDSDVILSLTMQTSNGKRFIFYLSEKSDLRCFSRVEKSRWKAQLAKGEKVSVKAYACSASGNGDLVISSIEFTLKKKTR